MFSSIKRLEHLSLILSFICYHSCSTGYTDTLASLSIHRMLQRQVDFTQDNRLAVGPPKRVFGQHLVSNIVLKAVVGHLNDESPSKALALSFNGWTGSGKNFVSQIIAEHLFRKGMGSKYVHLIISTHDFPHHSELDFYKRKLRAIVAGSVAECPRSLFIFDAMDKMPIGLTDTLIPYLDHYPDVGKVDFR